MSYYAIVTSFGAAKFAEMVSNGQQLVLQDFAVGDGNGSVYDPVAAQTTLRRETYRGIINSLIVDPNNDKQVIAECLVPENSGGWYIRELGIFDEAGDLILIAKYPETYKPSPADGALLKQFTIKMVMEVGSPDNVALSIEAGSIATIEYVDNKKALLTDSTVVDLSNNDNYLTPYSFANLNASQAKPGTVQMATNEETQAQEVDYRALSPGNLPSLRATLEQLTGGATNRFITPAVLIQLLASTTQSGLLKLATDAQLLAMTSDSLGVTPKNLAALIATLIDAQTGTDNKKYITSAILNQMLTANNYTPIGAMMYSAGTIAPAGFLIANGAVLSKTTYARLWAYAQTSGNLSPNNADWVNGNWGRFCNYDVSNFRIPLIQDDFIRGISSSRAIGTWQDSDNKWHAHGVNDPGHNHYVNDPGHTHGNSIPLLRNDSDRGTLSSNFSIDDVVTIQRATTGIWLSDAATSISIQGSGDSETRPRNLAYPVIIRYM